MPDIVDRHVVMLAPKEGYSGKFFAVSDHIQCSGLPLTFGDDPVLHANVAAGVRIRPTCDVAGSKYPLRACFKIRIHNDPTLDGDPRFRRKVNPGADADSGNYQVSFKGATTFQSHLIFRNRQRRLAEVKNDTTLFMERLHESADIRT